MDKRPWRSLSLVIALALAVISSVGTSVPKQVRAQAVADAGGGSWSYAQPMPSPRTSFAAVLGPNGRIYVIGGEDNNGNKLNTVSGSGPEAHGFRSRYLPHNYEAAAIYSVKVTNHYSAEWRVAGGAGLPDRRARPATTTKPRDLRLIKVQVFGSERVAVRVCTAGVSRDTTVSRRRLKGFSTLQGDCFPIGRRHAAATLEARRGLR